jgi:hypothetical protein
MSKLILFFYLLTGKVEKVDGLYTIHTTESSVIEYACEGEVLEYIETGVFRYDDNLAKPGELE